MMDPGVLKRRLSKESLVGKTRYKGQQSHACLQQLSASES